MGNANVTTVDETPKRAGCPRHADKAKERGSSVQSVERSLDILEALGASGSPVGIVDLAQRTELHVSTAHRLLSTLISRGYALQDPQTNKYALGLRVLQLASQAIKDSDLRSIAKPFLQRLMETTQETANLVVLDCDDAVYIEQVEGPRLVRMFTKIGRRVPLHCTGVGKVLLSHLPEERIDAIIAKRGLPAFTPKTITDPNSLKTELRSVRAQGFALDNEEQEEGVRCVAAPVYDRDWQPVAAISISAPVTRLTTQRAILLASQAKAIAFDLSARLGFKANL